jgi:hypothetical protein
MRKYRGFIRKNKPIIRKPVLPKKPDTEENIQAQMDSFELEYQKFIEELKAKKNEKTTQGEDSQLLQSNG